MSNTQHHTHIEFHALFKKQGPSKKTVSLFRKVIKSYFRKHGRHSLPWRLTDDPYCILVSEIMLQQTQVERVNDKYRAFTKRFPDFRTLAGAPLRSVLKVWQGLGYNRRAIALHNLAKTVLERMEGQLPSSPDILETLPGIGKATAASICAFAFNKPVIFIETNIRRVFLHFFFYDKTNVNDKEILPLIEKTLVRSNARQWYSALMDYGAMLKKGIPNPNVKSMHYSRQSPFEGSNRQLRGKIIRIVTEAGTLTAARLIEQTEADPHKVRTVLMQLQKEGFLKKNPRGFTIG